MKNKKTKHENSSSGFSQTNIKTQSNINFSGKNILFIYKNSEKFKNQFNLNPQQSQQTLDILNDISTDHIIRVSDLLTDFESLGENLLCGMEEKYDIKKGLIKEKGIKILVAGERFGCGSSREQAVWALIKAGIVLVIAKSFGPIFQKNASYLGLLTSSNFNLLQKIQQKKPLKFKEFLAGKDLLTQQIIISGGLFKYLEKINSVKNKTSPLKQSIQIKREMNIFEKRIASRIKAQFVKQGQSILLPVDTAYTYAVLSDLARESILASYGKIKRKLSEKQIYFFEDHFALLDKPEIIQLEENQKIFAQELKVPINNYFKARLEINGGVGICHRVMLEKLDPRHSKIVIATDSHTPTIGLLPIIPIPVGSTLFGAGLAEGEIPYTIPPVVRIDLTGSIKPGISIRDIQFELAQSVKNIPSGTVIEFGGTGFNRLSVDYVAALCNMVPELFNAETAVCEKFEAGVSYLSKKLKISKKQASALYVKPDKKCKYFKVVNYNMSKAVPCVALPGSPTNIKSLKELNNFPRINKAFLISCTLGLEDLVEAAAVLKDRKVAKETKLIVIPSSKLIINQAIKIGIIDIFKKSGAIVSFESACGPCIGQGLGSLEDNEIAISASNRNYPGRMGSKTAKAYLGGSFVTALSAVLGQIPTDKQYKDEITRVMTNLKKINNIKNSILN